MTFSLQKCLLQQQVLLPCNNKITRNILVVPSFWSWDQIFLKVRNIYNLILWNLCKLSATFLPFFLPGKNKQIFSVFSDYLKSIWNCIFSKFVEKCGKEEFLMALKKSSKVCCNAHGITKTTVHTFMEHCWTFSLFHLFRPWRNFCVNVGTVHMVLSSHTSCIIASSPAYENVNCCRRLYVHL